MLSQMKWVKENSEGQDKLKFLLKGEEGGWGLADSALAVISAHIFSTRSMCPKWSSLRAEG
uniref:Uncharacterized protein n=1 Tax=Anguilla anguilla TaxID=7936 RepID=A0A0E9WJU0_ANGAN